MKKKIAWLLAALLALSLLATSFVTARPLADSMDSTLFTLPEGSTHPSYDGDYVGGDRDISLTSGWTTNLPYNTCAIAVRLAYKDDALDHWAALRPGASGVYGVMVRTQVVDQWADGVGIVPITTCPPAVRLDISSAGYVYMQIIGYWVCDDYVRPTPAP